MCLLSALAAQRAHPSTRHSPSTPPQLCACYPLPCSSVPSGRVGSQKDSVFRSNDHFREAVAERQSRDLCELEAKLGRK